MPDRKERNPTSSELDYLTRMAVMAEMTWLATDMEIQLEARRASLSDDQVKSTEKKVAIAKRAEEWLERVWRAMEIEKARNGDLERINIALMHKIEELKKENDRLRDEVLGSDSPED